MGFLQFFGFFNFDETVPKNTLPFHWDQTLILNIHKKTNMDIFDLTLFELQYNKFNMNEQ